ncbi:BgTH12-05841 [Blumeria graminis f. sp. triticale]|nr:BgTH12-05841 [Blumeria graminis f. sp. triticale]VDB90849.1 Bgt-4749 [Blumeria graminis f. sp. tritici]
MSISDHSRTQVAPVQSHPSSPTHNSQRSHSQSPISIEKSSTSSSSSYLEISRSIPARKSRIRTFFTAPSEQKQKLKKEKTRKHFFRFRGGSGSSSSSNSSSSVDSDLAYGTGFIKLPRSRKKRHKVQERIRQADCERNRASTKDHYEKRSGLSEEFPRNYNDPQGNDFIGNNLLGKDQKLHPSKKTGKFSRRQQDATSTTASILAIGSGLARIAAHQNKTTTRPASDRHGRGFQSNHVPKSPESPLIFDKFSESSWESTSSSDSSSSVDSRLAYENEPSPSWMFFGKKKIDKNFRDPSPERILHPRSQSRTPNYVDKAVGSDEIPPWTANKKNYQNYDYLSANVGTNELSQKRDLNTQNKFDSNHTSNFKAAEVKLHTNSPHNLSNQSGRNATSRQENPLLPQPFNPPPLQIIQPQPVTPVSSSLYGPIYNAHIETLPSLPDEEYWPQSFTNAMNSNVQLRRSETSKRDLDHQKLHQLPQEEHRKSLESGDEIQRCELRLAEIERERIELQNKERHESQRRDRAKLAIQMEIERRKSKEIRDNGRDQETKPFSNRYGPEPESSRQIDIKGRILSNDKRTPQNKTGLHKNPENGMQLDKYSEFQINPINHIPPATVINNPLQFQIMRNTEAPITTQNLVQRKGLEFLPTDNLSTQKDLRYQHPVQRYPHSCDYFHNHSKNQTGQPFFEANENQQEKKYSNDDLATVTNTREQDITAKAHPKDTNSGKLVDRRPGFDYKNIESQLSSMPRHNLDIPGSNKTSPETSSMRKIVTNVRPNSTPPTLSSGVNFRKKSGKYVTTASVAKSEMDDRQVHGKYYVAPDTNSTSDDVPERQEKLQNINSPKNRFVHSHDEDPQKLDAESIETSPILNSVQSTLLPSTEMGKDVMLDRQSPTYIHSEKKRQPIIESIHSPKNKSVPKSRQPSTSKGVTWGRNETKHYEVESLSENQDEYFDNPDKEALEYSDSEFDYNTNKVRESPFNNANKSMGGRNIATGADSTHGVLRKSKYNYYIAKSDRPNKISDLEEHVFENSPQKENPKVFPSRLPEKLESITNIPGAFQDDFDFTATLAAGLQDTGFDPNIVIDNLTFHQNNKKHSSENLEVFYHAPYAETVSDLDLYSARTPEYENVSNEYYLNETRARDQGWQDVLSLSRSVSPKDSKNKQKFNKGRKSRGKDIKIARLNHIALPEASTESHENCNEAYISNAEDLDEDSRKKDISLSSSMESMSSLNSRKDIDVNVFKNALFQKKEGIHYKTRQNSDLSSYLVPNVDFSYIIPSSESKNFDPRGEGIVNASSLDAISTNNNPETTESSIYKRGSRKSDQPSYRRANKALSSAIQVINKDPRKIPSKRHQTTSFSASKSQGRFQNHTESEESSTEVERVSVPIDSFEFLSNNYGTQSSSEMDVREPSATAKISQILESRVVPIGNSKHKEYKTRGFLGALDTADIYSDKITGAGDLTQDTDKISTSIEVFVDLQDECLKPVKFKKPKFRQKKEIYQAFNEEMPLPEICQADSSESLVLGPDLLTNTANKAYEVVKFPFKEKNYLQANPSSKDSHKNPKGSTKNCYKNTLKILHSSQISLPLSNSHSQGHVSKVKRFKSREDSDNDSNLELLESRYLKADETQNHNARYKEVGHHQLLTHDQFISLQSVTPSELDKSPSPIKKEGRKSSKAERVLSQTRKKYEHGTEKTNKKLNYCSTSTESLIPCTSSSTPFQYDSVTDTCSPKPNSKKKYRGKELQQKNQPKLENAPLVLYRNSILSNANNFGIEVSTVCMVEHI